MTAISSKLSDVMIDRLFLLSNGLSIVGAICVVLGTGNIAENRLSFAGAVLVAIGAISVFGFGVLGERRARRAIATSNAIAASALAEVAKANAAIAQLKASQAWRRLGEAATTTIIARLSQVPAEDRTSLWVQFVGQDSEVTVFQEDIRAAITTAGFDVHFFSGWERAVGLKLSNVQLPTGQAIADAFRLAGIHCLSFEGDIPSAPGPGEVQILVGSRPPPSEANVSW